MDLNFDLPKENNHLIKVIGVGGGGSNAVNHMFEQGINDVDFIICNTDLQALDNSPVTNKLQIGASLTDGLGAGSIAEMGRNAAMESIEDIKDLLRGNTKMVFITAGMGGGTGTGAAPVIAEAARELDILTVGIVTVPFSFEGRKRKVQAEEGLESMRNAVDALIVVNNDKLRHLYGNLTITNAFSKADDVLTVAAKGIAETITGSGYINVDFNDVRTVMKDGGVAVMGTGIASGEDRATQAVEQALSSPLLNDNDITGANYVLLNITYGDVEVSMDEQSDITDFLQHEAGDSAEIIWGLGYDETLGDAISVTVVATGFQTHPIEDDETIKEKVTLTLEAEKEAKEIAVETNELSETEAIAQEMTLKNVEAETIAETTPTEEEKPQVEKVVLTLEDELPEAQNTVSPQIDTITKEERERMYQERMARIKRNSEFIKNPNSLSDLEKKPAYLRRDVKLDDTPHSSENNTSNYFTSDDNGNIKLNSNNSFLHDNVD